MKKFKKLFFSVLAVASLSLSVFSVPAASAQYPSNVPGDDRLAANNITITGGNVALTNDSVQAYIDRIDDTYATNYFQKKLAHSNNALCILSPKEVVSLDLYSSDWFNLDIYRNSDLTAEVKGEWVIINAESKDIIMPRSMGDRVQYSKSKSQVVGSTFEARRGVFTLKATFEKTELSDPQMHLVECIDYQESYKTTSGYYDVDYTTTSLYAGPADSGFAPSTYAIWSFGTRTDDFTLKVVS